MRIRAPPVIYLKTDEKLNTGRFILRTLPLLYLKHLISKYRGGFFVSGQIRPYHKNNISQIKGGFSMAFFASAIDTLKILVIALGAGLGAWGVINLLEGYGNDNPGAKSQG